MRTALLAVALLALPAMAGERLLGTITSSAGADTTNVSTAVPFKIPFAIPITIQCNATAYVVTDTATAASSTTAIRIAADFIFPTSTGSSGNSPAVSALAADGGILSTDGGVLPAKSAVVRVAGPAAVACQVWSRAGTE